eukprot:jgi/Psemu1/44319/gm1.44319_g
MKERQRLVRRERGRDAPQHQQQERDLGCGERCELGELALDHRDPVNLLVEIEKELEPDHREEGPAEAGNADMGGGYDPLIFARIVEREVDRFDRAEPRRDGDDRQREDNAHAEYGEGDAPGQEAALPDLVHFLEDRGIDHRIVEAERYFQHRQDRDDPQQRQCAGRGRKA